MGPLILLWLAPRLVRRWRQVALMLSSVALCLLVSWAVGPFIMARVALPQYRADIDHRPKYPLVWPDDPHYNRRGNRLAARAIVRHLMADGLLRQNP